VVVTEAMGEAGGTTITLIMTKVERQIAMMVEDTVKEDMDVVVEVEESSVITIKNLDIIHLTVDAS
jgi:indole-3-glycerol phosphate synthase